MPELLRHEQRDAVVTVVLETLEYTKSYLWTNPDPEDWLAAELDQVMHSGMTIQR